MGHPELQVEQLTYFYPDASRPTLDGINWQVQRGEFVLLVGTSGSGKSTFLRALNALVPEFYGGKIAGRVQFRGGALYKPGQRNNSVVARHVGMVFQDPERQLVMTEVEREIAFGLENFGVEQREMGRRVAEVMSFFDLTELRNKRTADLSGGEKQRVAIASVMALQPDVLLLDEPTSQLDPGHAQEILDLLKRLNDELGTTVVLVEQRLDRVLHLADRITALHQGRIEYDGAPTGFAQYAAEHQPDLLPPVTKVFVEAGSSELPLTVKEARKMVMGMHSTALQQLRDTAEQAQARSQNAKGGLSLLWMNVKRMLGRADADAGTVLLQARQVRFAYPKQADVLKGIDAQVYQGEITAMLGANGTGKSTLLRHFAVLLRPDMGKVTVLGTDTETLDAADLAGRIGYLSQNPGDYLFHETLWQECEFSRKLVGLSVGDEHAEREIAEVLNRLGILGYRDSNPRDLSGGERQRAALATVLVQKPQVLLLDEPTRGLDAGQKERLGHWLQGFTADGGTVVLITHDMEFAAEYAQHVMLIDDGVVVAEGTPQEMFTRGMFYSTQVARVFRDINHAAVRTGDGIELLKELQASKGEPVL